MAHRKTAPLTPRHAGSRDISLTIPVAPEMEIVATAQAAALGEYLGMSRDKIDEVRLALVEACINAFEHAQTRDERLHLTFRMGREDEGADWLEIEVLDQGKGFDHLRIEPPTPEQTFQGKRKRGWGLQIIRSLMDSVQISSGDWGTRIVMRKYK
ncbi:MAG TPA: ATP-binding protein [Thermoanaerobaculia bacterium]|nr:ATP-binding protein [Thermoanaerobaculia bacterium]